MPVHRLFLFGALAALLWFGSPGLTEDLRQEALKGWDLTAAEAAELERGLAANPEDLNARARLLGYYFRHHRTDPSRRAGHILWFIRNAPEAEVLEGPEAQIMPVLDPEGFAAAKEAWLQQIESEPRNVTLLRHAAAFFTLSDETFSAELLMRAEDVEPSSAEWARELGQIHWREARQFPEGWDAALAERALADFERAYALSEASGRGPLLPELAMAAFVIGDTDKARTYAETMLADIPDDWNRGNRVHYGNLVLGRVALADGDLRGAAQYLLAAGRTPGSPQLNSFGPDMALARDLLERGETQTVLRYLALCLDFWEMGQASLKNWIALIEGGRTPDFSRHLRF
ncbi:MAG: RNA polymerase subunit sigma-24 [Acidobacteria bacterium]|nr:RNA polymerase subunit sigma-24 [Acidobacteriota bacterium]MXW72382.1 RNA polymerase subunit sigma-24 [Acidobacteriota bacterium]MYE43356.1 RNA polymerase subunit sigma-24 [Acidobacteriota bacterium]